MKAVFACGGSGGHILPAIRVAKVVRDEQGGQVFFVGRFGAFADLLQAEHFSFAEVPVRGLRGNSLKSLLGAVYSMIQSTLRTRRVLKDIAPDVIMGFGGYGSVPAVVAGRTLGIPLVIHEQNVIPGRANVWLSRVVDRVAISTSETAKGFGRRKTILTGYPTRDLKVASGRDELLASFGLERDRSTIFVCGGSQGSRAINQAMLSIVPVMRATLSFQVIHAAGELDVEVVRQAYERNGIPARVVPYLDEMPEAYACSDLVIARAGAGMIHELLAAGVPAVIIPYPYAGAHQKANAALLAGRDDVVMIEERHLTSDHLRAQVVALLGRGRRGVGQKVFSNDAARRIAALMMEVA